MPTYLATTLRRAVEAGRLQVRNLRYSPQAQQRLFATTSPRLVGEAPASPNALPAGKPVGAFRGGLLGFLLGASVAAYGSYYYLYDDYHRSNDLLNEDMYALQAAVTRLSTYVASLENKVDQLEGKRR